MTKNDVNWNEVINKVMDSKFSFELFTDKELLFMEDILRSSSVKLGIENSEREGWL